MDILGTKDLQITHLPGAAVLQNAMAESGYALKKSKLSQLIAIYLIQQMFKRENCARRWMTEQQRLTRLHAKRYLPPKKTSVEKQRPIFQHTTQNKGQLTERVQEIVHKLVSPHRWNTTVTWSSENISEWCFARFSCRLSQLSSADTTILDRGRNLFCNWTLELASAKRWNCERIKKAYPRTNNSVEGQSSDLVKLVNTKHPSLPKLIEELKDEQRTRK